MLISTKSQHIMSSKSSRFVVLCSSLTSLLSREVDYYLNAGWKLYGHTRSCDDKFFQTVIKYNSDIATSTVMPDCPQGIEIKLSPSILTQPILISNPIPPPPPPPPLPIHFPPFATFRTIPTRGLSVDTQLSVESKTPILPTPA